MGLLQLKIDNSKKHADHSKRKWKDPGAKLYDQCLNAFYCQGDVPCDTKQLNQAMKDGTYKQWPDFLKEVYLVAPVSNIKNSPYGVTPYSKSGCKYPHHVIRNGELVLSVSGLKRAWDMTFYQKSMTPEVKRHLNRHMKELGIEPLFHHGQLYWKEEAESWKQIDSNFRSIDSYLNEQLGINLSEDITVFDESYDPPLEYDKLPIYLKDDPIHAWRAKSGIELIHKEPTIVELNRIWNNWNQMSDDQKRVSDEKSYELFGKNNLDHYRELVQSYSNGEDQIQVANGVNSKGYIRPLNRKDVTGEHFIDWFFKMDEFQDDKPENFDFDILVHNPAILNYCYGYFVDMKLEGIIRVRFNDEQKSYSISMLFVNTDKWRMGIGDSLMKYAVSNFGKFDLYLRVFAFNHKAISLYTKYDFKIINSDIYEDGPDRDPKFVGEKMHIMKRDAVHVVIDSYQITESVDTISQIEEGLQWIESFVNDETFAENAYITEKKTRLEYSMEKFKRKYQYDPKNKTIIVDGIKIYADIDIDKPVVIDPEGCVVGPRMTAAYLFQDEDWNDHPFISLDRAFFYVGGQEKEESILQHELGHIILQLDKTGPSSKRVLAASKEMANARNAVNKYVNPKVDHINPLEFEADRYAANRTSEKALKRGIRLIYKYASTEKGSKFNKYSNKVYWTVMDGFDSVKSMDDSISSKWDAYWKHVYEKLYVPKCQKDGKTPIPFEKYKSIKMNEKKRKESKSDTINAQLDMAARSKALKDPVMRSTKVYKKEDGCQTDDGGHIVSVGDLKKYEISEKELAEIKKRFMKEGKNMDDDLDWIEKYIMEEGEDPNIPPSLPEEPPKEESMPKKTDKAESSKNGVRRKNLYIEFIKWCKDYNPKNTFGSIFDKDAFNVTYPFIPEELRYFYRLANPMLCVLGGNLTFFAAAELRRVNAKNSHMTEMLIFAATDNDVRVFNIKDKKVYRGTEENGTLKLNEVLGDTFDTYIQKMIDKGDILNAPIEESVELEP